MRILALADVDDLSWRGGRGNADVVVACGDLFHGLATEAADAWECSAVFAVKGNHDRADPFPAPIVDLHLTVSEHAGLRFGGLNGAWRYKPRGHFLYEQHQVEALLAEFPPVDVFVSHNSPRGVHDVDDGIHFGFDGLLAYTERCRPRLVIHGHQHVNAEVAIGPTRIVGVYGHRLIEV